MKSNSYGEQTSDEFTFVSRRPVGPEKYKYSYQTPQNLSLPFCHSLEESSVIYRNAISFSDSPLP